MLATLGTLAMTVVGLILLRLGLCKEEEHFALYMAGVALTLFSSIFLGAFLITISVNHCYADKRTEDMLLKRKSIESLMNVTKDSSAYAYVVQKAYEWNCDVTKTKRHANSLWLNWFYPKEYVDSLEYIEVK